MFRRQGRRRAVAHLFERAEQGTKQVDRAGVKLEAKERVVDDPEYAPTSLVACCAHSILRALAVLTSLHAAELVIATLWVDRCGLCALRAEETVDLPCQ